MREKRRPRTWTPVRRPRTTRPMPLTDAAGTTHRLTLTTNEYGTFRLWDRDGLPVSPRFYNVADLRGWLLANALTPLGQRSPLWAQQIARRTPVRRAAAA